MQKNRTLRLLVTAALLAALTTVATMVIHIPTPSRGYIHPGDCIVILSGWLLGPVFGGAAAGLGSALADLMSGYAIYAPATLLIKWGMAAAAWAVCHYFKKSSLPVCMMAAVLSEVIMMVGYALFAMVLLGSPHAFWLSLPENLVQGVFGAAVSVLLYKTVLNRVPGLPGIGSHEK